MGFSAVSVVRGPGEIAAMVVEVTKAVFTTQFQFREFIEQAWFITSVTLMPTILVSIPFGAVISLQVGNLTGQLGAQSFAGATAVLAVVREAAPIAAALIIAGAAGLGDLLRHGRAQDPRGDRRDGGPRRRPARAPGRARAWSPRCSSR